MTLRFIIALNYSFSYIIIQVRSKVNRKEVQKMNSKRKFKLALAAMCLFAAAFGIFTACSPTDTQQPDSGQPSVSEPDSGETPLAPVDPCVTVYTICGTEPENGNVTLKEADWVALSEADDAAGLCRYSVAEGVSVTVSVDRETRTIFFTGSAEGVQPSVTRIAVSVLSSATDLAVRSVCGGRVENGSVALSTAVWQALCNATDVAVLCEYSAAESAQTTVVLDKVSRQVIFTATARDMSVQEIRIQVNVLSDDTSMTVHSIAGSTVSDGICTVTADQWREIAASEQLKELIDAELADGAGYTAVFDRENSRIAFSVTAEDGTQDTFLLCVEVEELFGTYYGGSLGDPDFICWDTQSAAYVTDLYNSSAALYAEGEPLSGDYAVTFEMQIADMVSGGEFGLSVFARWNKLIRLVIRAESDTKFCVFTDYRDDGNFLNYTEVVSDASVEDGIFRIGMIVSGNDVAMLWDDHIVYHRALDGLEHSEFVVMNSPYALQAKISEIEIVRGESARALYREATADYRDALVGNTIGATNSLEKCIQDLENGTVRVDMSGKTSGGPMVSFYHKGNPLAGYSWAVTGTLRAITVAGRSGHIGFMCYVDNNNWSRFTLNRREGNNSCYYRTRNNGIGDPANNTLCTDMAALTDSYDWTAEFAFLYDSGTVMLYVENKLMCRYETDWGVANAIMEVIQNVDITYSDLYMTTDPLEVEQIRAENEKAEPTAHPFVENQVFTENAGLSFVKRNTAYANAALREGDGTLCSDVFYVTLRLGILDPQEWGQGEIMLIDNNDEGVSFFLEYLKSGSYQIFTQRIASDGSYFDWKLVASGVPREIDFGVAVYGGKIIYFMDGQILFEYEVQGEFRVFLGGQRCVIRVKDVVVNMDPAEVGEFVGTLEEYVYRSPYQSRADAYAQQYAGAATGQTLLVGASTLDFWRSTRIDSDGIAVKGYLDDLTGLPDADGDGSPDVINVGIGATTWLDWLSFYDQLVKPFAPSRLILYCGSNDVYNGTDAEETYARFEAFMRRVRADFPEIEVYYVNIMPSPTLYNNQTVWARAEELSSMIAKYAETDEHFTVIDLFDTLCPDGSPAQSLWDADNTHLNSKGYAVFAKRIREALGLEA